MLRVDLRDLDLVVTRERPERVGAVVMTGPDEPLPPYEPALTREAAQELTDRIREGLTATLEELRAAWLAALIGCSVIEVGMRTAMVSSAGPSWCGVIETCAGSSEATSATSG